METEIVALHSALQNAGYDKVGLEQVEALVNNQVEHIEIAEDYSNYDSNGCNNGGSYGFWSSLYKIGEGLYEVCNHTTADFDYCRACGSFTGHDEESCGFETFDVQTSQQKIVVIEADIRHLKEQIAEKENAISKLI